MQYTVSDDVTETGTGFVSALAAASAASLELPPALLTAKTATPATAATTAIAETAARTRFTLLLRGPRSSALGKSSTTSTSKPSFEVAAGLRCFSSALRMAYTAEEIKIAVRRAALYVSVDCLHLP
jgi:hypothetical protein